MEIIGTYSIPFSTTHFPVHKKQTIYKQFPKDVQGEFCKLAEIWKHKNCMPACSCSFYESRNQQNWKLTTWLFLMGSVYHMHSPFPARVWLCKTQCGLTHPMVSMSRIASYNKHPDMSCQGFVLSKQYKTIPLCTVSTIITKFNKPSLILHNPIPQTNLKLQDYCHWIVIAKEIRTFSSTYIY